MKIVELWRRTKEILEEELSKNTFEKWISPLELDCASEDDELILIAPSTLNKKELKKYISFIDNTIFYNFNLYKLITVVFEEE